MEVVIRSSYQYQVFFDDVVSQRILWKHSHHSVNYYFFWVLFNYELNVLFFKSSWIPSMVSVYFLKTFSLSEQWIINIYNDTLIRVGVDFPIVAWSMLSPDKLRNHNSHSSYRKLLSIEKMVCSSFEMYSYILTLCLFLRQLTKHVLILLINAKFRDS